MSEPLCPNCRTPQSQWRENHDQGFRVDNHVFCSKECSREADESIRTHGSIDQDLGQKLKESTPRVNAERDRPLTGAGWTALDDGLERACAALENDDSNIGQFLGMPPKDFGVAHEAIRLQAALEPLNVEDDPTND